MTSITEWIVEQKLAENGFAAGHMAEGLKLAGLPREEQEARCRLYRLWRNNKEAKKSTPAKEAYYFSILGLSPEDVETMVQYSRSGRLAKGVYDTIRITP